jgi:hypothetical protein
MNVHTCLRMNVCMYLHIIYVPRYCTGHISTQTVKGSWFNYLQPFLFSNSGFPRNSCVKLPMPFFLMHHFLKNASCREVQQKVFFRNMYKRAINNDLNRQLFLLIPSLGLRNIHPWKICKKKICRQTFFPFPTGYYQRKVFRGREN